jgi:hypothetical protein
VRRRRLRGEAPQMGRLMLQLGEAILVPCSATAPANAFRV